MDYKQIIDKLVRELSFRVGVPNIHNKEHQSIMSEILSEWGEYDIKEVIFNHLNEKDKDGIDDDTEVVYRTKMVKQKKLLIKMQLQQIKNPLNIKQQMLSETKVKQKLMNQIKKTQVN